MSDRAPIVVFSVLVLAVWGTVIFALPIWMENFLFGSGSESEWRATEPIERYGVYGYESRWEPLVETFNLSESDKLAVRELFIDYMGYNRAIRDLYHARHISSLEYPEQRMAMGEFLSDYLSAYLTATQLELVLVYDEAFSNEFRRRMDEKQPGPWSNNIFPEICGELGICP